MPVDYSAMAPCLIKKGEEKNIVYELELPDKVTAPVEKGQRIGTVTLKSGGTVIGEFPVNGGEDIGELTFGEALKKFFCLMFGISL